MKDLMWHVAKSFLPTHDDRTMTTDPHHFISLLLPPAWPFHLSICLSCFAVHTRSRCCKKDLRISCRSLCYPLTESPRTSECQSTLQAPFLGGFIRFILINDCILKKQRLFQRLLEQFLSVERGSLYYNMPRHVFFVTHSNMMTRYSRLKSPRYSHNTNLPYIGATYLFSRTSSSVW